MYNTHAASMALLQSWLAGDATDDAIEGRHAWEALEAWNRNTRARPMPFYYWPARALCPTAIGVPRCSSPCMPASISLGAFRV